MAEFDKRQIRSTVKSAVLDIPAERKRRASERIASAVGKRVSLSGARVVALFSPLPDEPMISPLIARLSKICSVVLPRVEGEVMNFYPYACDGMERGSFGIMEPQGGMAVKPRDIDLIVVPGVAFTKDGIRMGRGKGYYDKYMSQEGFRAHKIGVCYAEQVLGVLPAEPHDVMVDSLIYE